MPLTEKDTCTSVVYAVPISSEDNYAANTILATAEQPATAVPLLLANEEAIATAANIIAGGGIAAFPTETVYGLGADASNPDAVARVYHAKGRPGDNPLISHIADLDAFKQLTVDVLDYAHGLIKSFWPGPLTLVAKKSPGLPHWLGGHPNGRAGTIGIRMPSHPIALALIKESGCFIAAPSANKAGTPSPTCAQHVAADFADGSIDFILDGGAVPGGLESTVVDITGPRPVILRPGAITPEMVWKATRIEPLMSKEFYSHIAPRGVSTAAESFITSEPPRAPGMKYRHYAPKAPMTLLVGDEDGIAAYIIQQAAKKLPEGRKMGILLTTQAMERLKAYKPDRFFPKDQNQQCEAVFALLLGDKAAPDTIAKNLYACLRQFDSLGVDEIYAEGLTQDGLGIAIMDRMKKAAEGRVVHVPDKNSFHMHG